jgi:hypothetical protein
MPSRLHNLFRTLTWDDFTSVDRAPPGPNDTAEAAEIPVNINVSGLGVAGVPGTRSVTLADTLQVRVELGRCTVSSWVFDRDQAFQDNLLRHEQGHYDITALIARDWFLAMMRLKANRYDGAGALQQDINNLDTQIRAKGQPVTDVYDTDTQRGADATQQARWNGFISSAFNTPATPAQTAADGTSIKVTLLSVLAQAGIRV